MKTLKFKDSQRAKSLHLRLLAKGISSNLNQADGLTVLTIDQTVVQTRWNGISAALAFMGWLESRKPSLTRWVGVSRQHSCVTVTLKT